jgi:hypothetical protein
VYPPTSEIEPEEMSIPLMVSSVAAVIAPEFETIKFDEFDGYLSLGEHYINGYLRKENSSCVFEYPTC